MKLKNYKEFADTIKNTPTQDKPKKIKAAADYVEYIKLHDEEAYKNYLSYSTYLKLCV